MKKIGVKSGLLIICRIKIHHIIGFSKSVRSVLFDAICTGSVWRPCLFVYVLVRTIFTISTCVKTHMESNIPNVFTSPLEFLLVATHFKLHLKPTILTGSLSGVQDHLKVVVFLINSDKLFWSFCGWARLNHQGWDLQIHDEFMENAISYDCSNTFRELKSQIISDL